MSKNYPIIQRQGTAVPLAADIVVDSSGFANVLGAGDIDAQTALDTIDDMSFIDIKDTPATFTDQRILFQSGSAVVDSANFTYDSTNDVMTVGTIQFDLTPTHTHSEGAIHWDDDDKTLNIDTEVTGTSIQVGQETVLRATNKTGVTITNGSVVYVNGAQGNRPTIALADADTSATADSTIGVVTSDINNNQAGYVTVFGLVRDVALDPGTYTEGDTLWLSQTAGEYTNVEPASPAHAVKLGYVITANATEGKILVSINTGFDLEDIHDMKITSLADDDILQYNSATGLWENNSSPLLALADETTGVTQSPLDNSTKVATTAYVDAAVEVENLWDRTGTTLGTSNAGDDVSLGGDLFIKSDSSSIYAGADDDVSINYNGTDAIITTDLVAASDLVIDCGAEKTLELTESVWNDINVGGTSLRQGASNQPSLVDFDTTTILVQSFSATQTNELHGSFEIIHDYKEGTDLHPHLHWYATTTGAGDVRWGLEYSVENATGTVVTGTIYTNCTAPGVAWQGNICSFPNITGTGIDIGSQFHFRLFRDGTDAADTYASGAAIATVGVHYEIDTIGSRQIATK